MSILPENYNSEEALIIDPYVALTRVWATYFGGSGNDFIKATRTDLVTNKIYFVGHSQSIAFPPLFNNGTAYYTSNAGFPASVDAFIFRTSITGVREWCSYVFSTEQDNCYSVTTDNLGNVYMVGESSSNTSNSLTFPTLNAGNYYQKVNNCGQNGFAPMMDGFIVRFNSSGVITWATMFGSNTPCSQNYDGIYDVACNTLNEVYVIGLNSNQIPGGNFPFLQLGTGYFYNTYTVANKGFIARFNNATQLMWSTFTQNYTQNSIAINANNNLFVVGQGAGTPFPTFTAFSSAAYPNAYLHGPFGTSANNNQTEYDGTIMAFDINTNNIWRTYFGSSNGVVGIAGALDNAVSCDFSELNGKFYICGKTETTTATAPSNFPLYNANGGYYNSSFNLTPNPNNGNIIGHGWLAGFNTNFSQHWCTYFSGNGQDEAVKLSVNKGGNILLTGNNTRLTTNVFPLLNPGSPFYFDGSNNNVGRTEPYIAMFNAENVNDLLWSTYYGTDGTDEKATDIEVSMPYVVWTGNTQNNFTPSNITLATEVPTSWQQTTVQCAGGFDGVIAKFNAPGNVRLAQTKSDIESYKDLIFQLSPEQNQISLTVISDKNEYAFIDAILIDVSGKIVLEKQINSPSAEINIAGLASGVYFLKVKTNEEMKTFKFAIIKR